MFSLSANPEYAFYLLIWLGLWSLGGIWIVRRVFRLEAREEVILGVLTGLIIETILANFIGRVLPLPMAFWLCAVLVFVGGLLLNLKNGWKSLFQIKLYPVQLAVFLLLFGVSFLISRGFAIYDDFANLPTVSMIAAGHIPPIYSLNPGVTYSYHYFVMLFAGQMIRISGLYVWTAFDLARALVYALTITAAGLWGYRMTRSRIAGALTGVVTALGSGTRWLLLLIPSGILARLSTHITLIGSGADSGPTLAEALMNNWAIEGGGPRPFSFAFGNGLTGNGAMSMFASNSTINTALILLLLMTCNRWRNKWALVTTIFLIGATGLMSETGLVLITAGWGLLAVITAIRQRSLKFPPKLKSWLLAAAIGTAFALLQGGALTDTLTSRISALFAGTESSSYQTIGFALAWPPEIVSSQLGELSLFNPWQLLTALLEIGPAMLIFPLLMVWGWKAWRAERWYEAALVLSGVISLAMIFVNFTGSTGVRNTVRLYTFADLSILFFVPLAWMWTRRRKDGAKLAAGTAGALLLISGLVYLTTEFFAIQQPVLSYFIDPLDVKMLENHWDKLEEDSMVFDPVPSRSPTLFARASDSHITWYQAKPEWQALQKEPSLDGLVAADYDYLYMDEMYWDELPEAMQESLEDGCVRLIEENIAKRGQRFRRLYDLRGCK
ncbi:MAG: hypothetical protein RBT34_09525 [Anaerolineaceae bacterium]|jgi:hypothetical protein|nr:hypothetical protein [Anaerolineaceae bacterium]